MWRAGAGRFRAPSTNSLLAGAGGGGPDRRVLWRGPLEAHASWGRGRSSSSAGGAEAGRPGGVGRGRAAQRPSLRTVPFTATRPRTQDRHLASAHRRLTPPSLLPLSARLVVAEGRARRLFRPSQRCTITPAAGPSRQPRRPGDPALPMTGEPGQARRQQRRLSRTKWEHMPQGHA